MKLLDSKAEKPLPDLSPPAAPPEVAGAEAADPGLGRRLLKPRTLLSFAVAFGILAFFFTRFDLDLGRVVQTMGRANPALILLALLVYYCAFPLRGLRWQAMLRGCGIADPPPVRILSPIIFLSWFANCLLPAKLGDVYRAYLLRKHGGISISRAGGTVVAERILDFAYVLILLALAALAAFRGRVPASLGPALEVSTGIVLVAGIALLAMRRWEWLVPKVLPHRFHGHYARFHDGVMGSFNELGALVVLTPLGWACEVLRFYIVAQALGLPLGATLPQQLAEATFVALGSAIVMSAMPTPGGLGGTEAGITGALMLFGVSQDVAFAAALLDRLLSYWSLVVVGFLIYLFWESPRAHVARVDLPLELERARRH